MNTNRAVQRVTATTLAAMATTFACSPGSDADWQGTIEERDGVVWVNNPAAAPEREDGAPPLSLHLEQTFGAEEEPVEELLSFVVSLAVDDDGSVYAVDRRNERLVAFDVDGNLLWSAGRRGEGPGEFDGIGSVAWDGQGLLYVDNGNGGQIDTWTTTGEYVDSQLLTRFDIPQGWVAGLPDPSTIILWAWSRTQGDGVLLHVFDLTDGWRRTAEFFALGGRLADSDELGDWGHVTARPRGKHVLVGNRIDYTIREYDLAGTLRRVIARDHPELLPTFSYKGTGFGFGEFEAPLWLDADHGLLPRYWMVGVSDADEFRRRWDKALATRDFSDTRQFESALDLIDAEGRVLGSLPLSGAFHESIGQPKLIGPDGKLYTAMNDPYPHVRRYRVELAEPAGGG